MSIAKKYLFYALVIVAVICILLVVFYLSLHENCEIDETCIQICCDENIKCLDESSFNLSSLQDFKIIRRKPGCDMYEMSGVWELFPVSFTNKERDERFLLIFNRRKFHFKKMKVKGTNFNIIVLASSMKHQ
jgi:hypothetical protein